jgi:excinuclease ABC subunit C
MINLEKLKVQAQKLPHLPGVYCYKNIAGKVIYVGKAKDLHKRVNSYFKQAQDLKTSLLLNNIYQIEYTVTPTEIDALTLEDQLINEHQPHYNILLKTDSSYRYICLTKTNPPQISTCRKPVKNQYCLGPFPFATQPIVAIARDLLGLTKYQQINAPDWQLYLDSANFNPNKTNLSPKNIKTNLVFEEKIYQVFINKLIKTIKHGDLDLIKQYTLHMQTHAQNLEFEQALQYRNKIELLNKLAQRTSQINPTKINNQQLIVTITHQDQFLIFVFEIKHGLLSFIQKFSFDPNQHLNILENFLKQYYTQNQPACQILIYHHASQHKTESSQETIIIDPMINQYLSLNWQQPVTIEVVTKHKLLSLALQNIYAKLNLKNNLGLDLKKLLKLSQMPQTIDFIDISNFSDQMIVGGVIRFLNNKPLKNLWRLYTIKTVSGQDDYASLRETILRHYRTITKLPDILIVDGGIGQLGAVLSVMPDSPQTVVVGLAKKYETLIFANQQSLILSLHEPAGKFIIHGRDSVHNFVISHIRSKFKKYYKQSELDNILGIGPSTKIKLLTHFNNIKQIQRASLEDLSKVIGKSKAQVLIKHFNKQTS